MQWLARIARWALHPSDAALLSLVVVTVLGDVWCLALGGRGHPLSYPAYAVSAYTLLVAIIRLVKVMGERHTGAVAGSRVGRLLGSEGVRAGIMAVRAMVFDLAYAVFVLVTGMRYDSGWAIAVALYHVAVAALGFSVALGLHRARRAEEGERNHRELRAALACGILLAMLALALSVVMAKMVVQRKAWTYSTVVVITIATVTFVSLAITIRGIVLVRHADRPLLVASRAVAFSKAVVKLFFLETTMIAVFGKGDEEFRLGMESASGGVLFVAVVAADLALVAYAVRGLRREREHGSR